MSVHVSSQVWMNCQQSGDRLLLMLALADFANDDGICWPSQLSLAARTRCTERGVQKMIDALEKLGEIEIMREGGGRGVSAKYRLTNYTPKGEHGSSYPPRKKGERGAERANMGTIKGEQAVPPNHQEPSQEPSMGASARPLAVSMTSNPPLKTSENNGTMFRAADHADDDEPYIPPISGAPTQPELLPPAAKPDPKKKARGTIAELEAFAKEIGLPASDGTATYLGLEEKGWKDVKDWKARMRRWKLCGYHPSQKAPAKTNGHRHAPHERDEPATVRL